MARVQVVFPDDAVVFAHELDVRIGDVNYWNHLGHDALVSMLHETRARLFLAAGLDEGDTEGLGCVVADLAVVYRAEARFGQRLRVEVARGEVGRYGVELVYRVTCTERGAVVALAKTGHVFFTGRTPTLAPIPGSFLRAIGVGAPPSSPAP